MQAFQLRTLAGNLLSQIVHLRQAALADPEPVLQPQQAQDEEPDQPTHA